MSPTSGSHTNEVSFVKKKFDELSSRQFVEIYERWFMMSSSKEFG